MAYPRKLLNTGEELILDLRPHWVALFPSGAALAAAIVFGLVAAVAWSVDSVSWLALLLIVIALVWFVTTAITWSTTNFVLTSDRLISRAGFVSKSGIEIPLDRINTVFFRQSVFERMLGAGDLEVESAGERGIQSFSNIRKPSLVQREIYVQIEANENRKYDRVAGQTGRSAADELAKLHELLRQGAITQAEYDAHKARLLT